MPCIRWLVCKKSISIYRSHSYDLICRHFTGTSNLNFSNSDSKQERKKLTLPTSELTSKPVSLIKLPPKPTPPPPELCCMSGCAICVHDVYQEDLKAYQEAKNKLIEQLKERQLEIPKELEDDEEQIDPGLSAFAAFEKRLKK